MSAPASSVASMSKPTPRPPTRSASSRAVPTVRLATTTSCTPCWISAIAVASAIRPAPISSTRLAGRSESTSAARSSATAGTDADPVPIRVWERTDLPTSSAWRNSWFRIGPVLPSSWPSSHAVRTWPWISLSPTTIESRLEATRKSCAAARSSRST